MDTGRLIPADHASHYLVHLRAARPLKLLDLRTQANLDALDVDDRINTSHEAVVWQACHHLADAVRGWWDELDGITYRSRTTPQRSSNLAFFSLDGFHVEDCRVLETCVDELDTLVLHHQFTVGFPTELSVLGIAYLAQPRADETYIGGAEKQGRQGP